MQRDLARASQPCARATSGSRSVEASPAARACRRYRAGIRGKPPAESEKKDTGWRRSEDRASASAAATAAFAHRRFAEAAAERERRSRETLLQTSPWSQAAAAPALR